jgi:hypothetical protein
MVFHFKAITLIEIREQDAEGTIWAYGKEATELLTYLLTHPLTPWCKTLFEKLIVTQPVKKSCFLYGTRRFITVFTKVHHWTLS